MITLLAEVGRNLDNPIWGWFCPLCCILVVAIPVFRVLAWWLGRKPPKRRPKRRVW